MALQNIYEEHIVRESFRVFMAESNGLMSGYHGKFVLVEKYIQNTKAYIKYDETLARLVTSIILNSRRSLDIKPFYPENDEQV